MRNADIALQCFRNGYNCSQAILSTYCELFGMDKETALKLSCPFGGGVGRITNTCGAVSAAYMVIGLNYGNNTEGKEQAKELIYEKTEEFTRKFKDIHRATICKDLLMVDISTLEGEEYAKSNALWDSLCPIYICDVAQILDEMFDIALPDRYE
jgi:C_GCAxxG_C_C family probable redox protein